MGGFKHILHHNPMCNVAYVCYTNLWQMFDRLCLRMMLVMVPCLRHRKDTMNAVVWRHQGTHCIDGASFFAIVEYFPDQLVYNFVHQPQNYVIVIQIHLHILFILKSKYQINQWWRCFMLVESIIGAPKYCKDPFLPQFISESGMMLFRVWRANGLAVVSSAAPRIWLPVPMRIQDQFFFQHINAHNNHP